WRRLRDADVVLDVVAGEIVREAPERARYSALGWIQEWLPPDMPIYPPGPKAPLLVWTCTRPAVRRPNSAGSAPVISSTELAKRGLKPPLWPNRLTPSGKAMPLMRYCTLACSLRTWSTPDCAESCVTPGACKRI